MKLFIAIFVLFLVNIPELSAQNIGDSDKPIEITADSLEVIQPNKTASFRGNVQAVQGNIILTSNVMTVYYREGEAAGSAGAVSKIDAIGKVFLSTGEETGRGDKGIYNVDAKSITLLGDVVLTRGKNVLKGGKLVYNFATGRSLVTAGDVGLVDKNGIKKSSGRVKAIFVPNQKGKSGKTK